MNTAMPERPASRLAALALIAGLLAVGGLAMAGGLATGVSAQQQGSVPLNPEHPESYVVQRGDTLWDISAMFLRDPWFWPEIWIVNPQIENPHLIFPGDVLTLVYIDGEPRIRIDRGPVAARATERMSPRIREEALAEAITTIPAEIIGPFLSRNTLLERGEIDRLPYIVALGEDRLMGAAGNVAYVRGNMDNGRDVWSVVNVGAELVDPDTRRVLGYEGIHVAEGTVTRAGDPATLRLNASNREALVGDRLVQRDERLPLSFQPRAPENGLHGRIIHVVDGVTRIGQYQIVALNRGAAHGLEPGHVLSIWRVGETVTDRHGTGLGNRKVRLPDERAGHLMVFRTWDRLSYALVMQADIPIRTLDRVSSPD